MRLLKLGRKSETPPSLGAQGSLARTTGLLIAWPIFFMVLALTSLAIGIFPFTWGVPDWFTNTADLAARTTADLTARKMGWRLCAFLAWCISNGALGSIAYLSVNALYLQKDITFKIEETELVVLRIVVGILFAVILSIPFAWPSFVSFAEHAIEVSSASAEPVTPSARGGASAPSDALVGPGLYLLMPFLFGFSTAVVLVILGRFVSALNAFFGGVIVAATKEDEANKAVIKLQTSEVVARAAPTPPAVATAVQEGEAQSQAR